MIFRRLIPLLALVLVLAAGVLLLSDVVGVPSSKLEEEARFSHKIDADWPCTVSDPTDEVAAVLFYSPELDDFTYSIYINRPGFSFGWFFRGGGSVVEVEEYIAEFSVENYGSRAYVSMNAQRIARVEFGDDTVLELDPDKTFAIVVPPEHGSVQFYSETSEWIEPISRRL